MTEMTLPEKMNHCNGMLYAKALDPQIEDARRLLTEGAIEIGRLTNALHSWRAHPDYDYRTEMCGRKEGADFAYMIKDGWERNTIGDEWHSDWERFEYHEEHYFRRKK